MYPFLYYLCTEFVVCQRGPKVPSFIVKNMITENQLSGMIAEHLQGSHLFPVEVSIRPGNRIFVYIDGDTGVTIDDCKALNRYLESQIDRETEDYDLTVSTSGADRPLRFPRQYPKHTGRTFEILLTDDASLSGKLISADPEGIILEPTAGKKEKQKENITISFQQIKEAKIILSFK